VLGLEGARSRASVSAADGDQNRTDRPSGAPAALRALPPAKSIVTNLSSVIGGELLLRVANFGVMIVLARLYEASTVGMYATALAFSTVAVMLADNGLQVSAIAELSKPQRHPSTVVSRFYISKTLLAVPALALLATLAWLAKLPPAAWIIGALVVVRTAVQSYCQLQLAVLKGLHRMAAIGPVQGLHFAALLVGIGAVCRYHGSVYVLLGWLIAGQSMELLLSGGLLWRAGIRPARFALAECWSLLWRSTPIGFTYSIANLIVRLDVIVLSFLFPAAVVGEFAAANVFLVVAYVVSWLFGSVVLPELAARASQVDELERCVKRWTRLIWLAALPASLALLWVAPPAVTALYGKNFADTGRLASVMLLAAPFILLNSLYLSRAIALGLTTQYAGTYLATAVGALTLDLVVALTVGPMGVAVAIVVREFGMFVAFRILAGRFSPAGEVAPLGV